MLAEDDNLEPIELGLEEGEDGFKDMPIRASGQSLRSYIDRVTSFFTDLSPKIKAAALVVFVLGVFAVGFKSGGSSSGTPSNKTHAPTSEPKKAQTIATVSSLNTASTAAAKQLSDLDKYYSPTNYEQLNRGMEFGFDKQGKPDHLKGFQRVVDSLARSIVWNEPYRIGFIGSSVMAGHDNCYYDSYPEQMRRFLHETFTLAGLKLEIRNAGEGGGCGDSYQNQVFCIRHMVGEDIDMLHYSWTYFEHNEVLLFHDLTVRWASLLPKSPPVWFFNTGAWDKSVAQRVPDSQDRFKHTATSDKKFAESWADFGINGFSLERTLAFNRKYTGKAWGRVGDGVHNTTRYGEKEANPARRDSLGVVFRNWHPGPLGFQMASDAFSFYLLKALREACSQIADAMTSEKDLTKMWPHSKIVTSADFAPVNADHFWAKMMKLNDPPFCLNLEAPTFGRSKIYLGDLEDENNFYHDKNAKKPHWGVWSSGPNTKMVPKTELSLKPGEPGCVPKDSCGGIEAYSIEKDGYQSFMLPKMEVGFIMVCGFGKKSGAELIKQFSFELNGIKLQEDKYKLDFPQPKCLTLQTEWNFPIDDLGTGHLFLGAILKKDTNHPGRITHVVAA